MLNHLKHIMLLLGLTFYSTFLTSSTAAELPPA